MNNNNSNTAKKILYASFAGYEIINELDKCPCGCISDFEESKIYSRELESLTSEDLGFYCFKAMTTWGGLGDFKHFLPRLLEIIHLDRFNSYFGLQDIHNKLDYGDWKSWSQQEQKAIVEFIKFDWSFLVNQPTFAPLIDLEVYSLFLDLEELLGLWSPLETRQSWRNYIFFFYDTILDYNNVKIQFDRTADVLEQFLFQVEYIDAIKKEYKKLEYHESDFDYYISMSTICDLISEKNKAVANKV